MKTFDVTTEFATYKDCHFLMGNYAADGGLSLEIWNKEDGLIADITVCLRDINADGNHTFLDTNNCPWAIKLVENLEIAKPYGMAKRSGFCAYPLYTFDLDKLKEYVDNTEAEECNI